MVLPVTERDRRGGRGCAASTPALEAACKTGSTTETQQWPLQTWLSQSTSVTTHMVKTLDEVVKKNSLLVLYILKRTASASGSETLISQREK